MPVDQRRCSHEVTDRTRTAPRGETVCNEEVLAEFGLKPEDFERMAQTPLDPEPHHHGQ
jgi:hypothetical protein